jgi:peptidoglycan/xylan/chitin deacetylase (PgdA/CDA1 family)
MGIISFKEVTLSESYHLISYILLFLIALTLVILILVLLRAHTNFARRVYVYFHKHRRRVLYFVLILLMVFIVIFGIMQYMIYDLDKSTIVGVDEKIVIIEIDDYWNVAEDGAGPSFWAYGYTMERYRSVSDIIDKYGFVATLGVTPYIFEEYTATNFVLREDEEMVDYLNGLDSKGYELAMHGYNHCRNENFCPKYEEVWYNVFKGKLELQDIFKKDFYTYFPPGNTWTTEQYNNVKKAGFFMIGNTHVPKAYFDEGVIITPKGYDPIYVYDWYGLDFRHTSYEEWIDEYKESNLFILQLHCNTFDSQDKLEDLDKFLDYVKQDGAKVMTYKEFYDYTFDKLKSQKAPLTGNFALKLENED